MSGTGVLWFLVASSWLIAAIAGVVLLLTRRGPRNARPPTCGNCGYNLTGAASNRCPECGMLFIEAGVMMTSSSRANSRRWLGALLLAVVVTPLPCVLSSLWYGYRASRQAAVQAQAAAQAALSSQQRIGLMQAAAVSGVPPSTMQPWLVGGRSDVFRFTVSGPQARSIIQHLLRPLADRGYVPVILGSDDDLRRLDLHLAAARYSIEAILREAAVVDIDHWVERRLAEQHPADVDQPPPPASEITDHDSTAPAIDLQAGENADQLHLAVFPTPRSWEIPAWLNYRAGGGAPPPAIHVAILQHWQQRYDAQLVIIALDGIELAVNRPPENLKDALQLARAQQAYCPELVPAGDSDLENRATRLMHERTWQFAWD